MTAKNQIERDLLQFIKDDAERERHELAMLYQISQFMHGTLDLNEILHVILTAITSGCALGFSRAMILNVNRKEGVVTGKMGVGPASQEDAYRIWSELAKDNVTLTNFLDKYGRKISAADQYFDDQVRKIKIPLSKLDPVLDKIIAEKVPVVLDNSTSAEISWLSEFGATEYVAVPLIAGEGVVGIVISDNRYNDRSIDERMIRTLSLFATHAGMAYERAQVVHRLEQEKQHLKATLSELKETQNQLIHAERLATVGTMAAQIAHEVKNPLVAIGGFARSILKQSGQSKADNKLKTYANIIVEEVSRLEVFLSNVLNFSSISKAAVCLENINHIIEDTCALLDLQETTAHKKLQITKKLDPDVPLTLMNPQQIRQVMLNICQNAVQAMDNDGELSVRTCQIANKQIRIDVHDSGKGIPENDLKNIFNPFYTTKSTGSGLGLPISQQIIQNHGGKLEVSSRPGQGTTITITLFVIDDLDLFYNNRDRGLPNHNKDKRTVQGVQAND